MAPDPNRFHQDISRNLQFELHSYLKANPIAKLYDGLNREFCPPSGQNAVSKSAECNPFGKMLFSRSKLSCSFD
jgi:hypothetical protein